MYEHIAKNRAKTVLIIIGFVFFISILGYFIGVYIDYRYGISSDFSIVIMVIALVLATIVSFSSYFYSDRLVIAMSRARPLSRAEDPRVYYAVEGLSLAAGVLRPKIYIIDDPGLNAFATGRNPQKGVIVFTRGLLEKLNDEELKGVISHELSHIKNYDILLGTIVVVLVGMISIISNIMLRSMFFGGRGRRSTKGAGGGVLMMVLFIVGIVLILLSPLIAMLIKLAISRNREFLADSTGALISRYPAGLANALKKIEKYSEVSTASSATAHLFIVNPLGKKTGIAFKNLFNTHPPAAERIRRLEEMSLGVGLK